jgi:hypothetical protein
VWNYFDRASGVPVSELNVFECRPASAAPLANKYFLMARDRIGQTLDFVTGRGPVSKLQLRRCLSPVLVDDTLLVSDGNASYRYFARDAGISHQAVNISKGIRVRGAIHVQNVNAYHSRFREWMAASIHPKPCA